MATQDLVKYKNERTQIRRKFTESLNKLEQLFTCANEESSAVGEINEEFVKTSDKASRLFLLDDKINDLLFSQENPDEKELEKEYDTTEGYRDRWNSIIYKKQMLVQDKTRYNNNIIVSNDRVDSDLIVESDKSHLDNRYHLPKLEIKKFDGSIKHWISFWAQFKRIDESNNLDNEEKFQYLIQSTLENSPAHNLIKSFPPSACNYEKAIQQLKRRFGREELLIELYVRELLNLVLVQATVGKDNISLRDLYDKLETQLRSLESLGVTCSKYACMLYPLVESSLPESILKEWERRRSADYTDTSEELDPESSRMKDLMSFLRKEVESEERLALVKQSFTVGAAHNRQVTNQNKDSFKTGKPMKSQVNRSYEKYKHTPTATELVGLDARSKIKNYDISCTFCEGTHSGESCFKAQSMSLEELKRILKDKACCFLCFKKGHTTKTCRFSNSIKCLVCANKHATLLCSKRFDQSQINKPDKESSTEQNLSNTNYNKVLLQTLQVKLKGETPTTVRVLIDSGSQRSYVTKNLVNIMSYEPKGEEDLCHALFGGVKTEVKHHKVYKIRMESLTRNYSCNFDVLDSDIICSHVPVSSQGLWTKELKDMNITLSDCREGPVDVLIGADVAGKLMTGKTKVLSCGLVAVETLLGWTIMGRVRPDYNNFMMNINMLDTNFSVTDLWKLDVLGIDDPSQVKSREQLVNEAELHFNKTVQIQHDGRYEVRLPWLEKHAPLPYNFEMANKRLENTMKKLKDRNLVNEYENVFNEWIQDGVIEEVPSDQINNGFYLPHRPVIKEDSTTKIRPVFDASASLKGYPSLNQCLEKGTNLIELIPSLLLKFRFDKIGVIADIKKAFLQISLNEEDRDTLRFLWIDEEGKLKIFRHKRVVFGVSCSPFLLGAVMKHHLSKCENLVLKGESSHTLSTIHKLQRGFYVDNLVISLSNEDELESFKEQAKEIFASARFDLRGWEHSDSTLTESTQTHVLGHIWDKKNDTLKINVTKISMNVEKNISRRELLSATQKVFDTIGISCPTTLIPKLLIQKTWPSGGGWDTDVEENIKMKFISWISEIQCLDEIEIPRSIGFSNKDAKFSLHTFCDASQAAFAAVCFLRSEIEENNVEVSFLAAKSRVAPIKKLTIPRLELMAATIGSRLANSMLQDLENVETFYWTDSMTTLAWIKNDEPWGVFVYNRVQEIRTLTDVNDWRHVPGNLNPADVASRGCSPKKLMEMKWWEGPEWLLQPQSEWPSNKLIPNEVEVCEEKRKIVNTNPCISKSSFDSKDFSKYFSEYPKILRLIGWICRFLSNCKKESTSREKGDLTFLEITKAEKLLIKTVQKESFHGIDDKKLVKLRPFIDSEGIIRLKTKIWMRKDTEDFRAPVVLPSDHVIVQRLILHNHCKFGHMIGHGLVNILRENYWILRSRQTIRKVVNNCLKCKRQTGKPFEVESPPLPENRVRDAVVFEVTGIDLCGPLYVKEGKKVYVCIFTCAIFRAIHIEIVSSLETNTFIMAFRRFVARRGRPTVIYSDNGTNFKGMANALKKIDWEKVIVYSNIERIEWRFNPPGGPWWGGFWERLIGTLKSILRRVLGKTSLYTEELETVMCECEAFINSRPITYTSDDNQDPMPITPQMFIQEIKEVGVPDFDYLDNQETINRRLKYKLKLKEEIRRRFRIEYLAHLKYSSQNNNSREPIEGEVVLIETENQKRVEWPLAIVENAVKGTDGKVRVLHLRTSNGFLCRPVQRVIPLEIFDKTNSQEIKSRAQEIKSTQTRKITNKCKKGLLFEKENVKTRSGRTTKIPKRFETNELY